MAATIRNGDRANTANSNKSLIALPNDITSNLESISFEALFKDTSIDKIQAFRSRCHLLHVSVCVYAVYFAFILNKTKQLLSSETSFLKIPISSQKEEKPCLRVGIIGCGKMGHQIAKSLLSIGGLTSKNLLISTRRPELLKELINEGVTCIKDNTATCEFAEVLMLCVLPTQLPQLAKEIKRFIRPECIIYSIVAGMPISRLSFFLDTTNIVAPNLSWNEEIDGRCCWNYGENISTDLKKKGIDKILCQENSDNFIQIDGRFPETMIYAILNLCRTLSTMPLHNSMNLAQQIIFGEDVEDILADEDFFSKVEDKCSAELQSMLHHRSLIDLCKKNQQESLLMKKLKSSEELRNGFEKKFKEICLKFQNQEEVKEWDWICEKLKSK